jgi:bifunctional pyridoxal-dependent enzyme with beta-cystathionase and maltose regulon repressor activities
MNILQTLILFETSYLVVIVASNDALQWLWTFLARARYFNVSGLEAKSHIVKYATARTELEGY